ncbi:hypothetical protein GOM71_14575 [Paenibacillus sp. NEAU-GSW1]|nr:hypothetical protein [Paenibacillus sp. NEAU-GSW1]
MDHESLASACFKPLIAAYKEIESCGGDFSAQLYPKLTKGQQALFVFRTHYLHAVQTPSDYYWWTAYYLAQPLRWTALLKSVQFFGDSDAAQLLIRTEQALRQRNHPRSLSSFDVSLQDLDHDSKLQDEMNAHYDSYLELSKQTLALIARHIRSHRDQFVQLNP